MSIVVLIPTFRPDERLPRYVSELKKGGLETIILVDDGSGENYHRYFKLCEEEYGVVVLRHETNMGKGCALRTGFAWILSHSPESNGVITADCDGQHKALDVLRVRDALEDPSELILGCRDFSGEGIPKKSRYGNLLTVKIFHFLTRRHVTDTQTGLRGIGRNLLPAMIELPGDRYEYEMEMLVYAVFKDIRIREIPIETIYEEKNKKTHFRPFLDSVKIYGYLLNGVIRYRKKI